MLYEKEEVIQIYKDVLSGARTRFPKSFWDNNRSLLYSNWCVQYLIEEILKWDEEQVKKNMVIDTFIEHRLLGPVKFVHNWRVFDTLNSAYPDTYNKLEMKRFENNLVSDKDKAADAIKWFIECKMGFTDEQIISELNYELLGKHGLRYTLSQFDSKYEMVNYIYPGKFKAWELGYAKNYWKDESNRFYAIKWLLEKTGKTIDKLNTDDLKKNKLNGLFHVYNGSLLQLRNFYKAYEETNTVSL